MTGWIELIAAWFIGMAILAGVNSYDRGSVRDALGSIVLAGLVLAALGWVGYHLVWGIYYATGGQ
jgi:hypothetical protein